MKSIVNKHNKDFLKVSFGLTEKEAEECLAAAEKGENYACGTIIKIEQEE